MTSQLRKIDLQGEILVSLKAAGRITQVQYDARLKKLVERASAILAKRAK